jgi:hypothetical protein
MLLLSAPPPLGCRSIHEIHLHKGKVIKMEKSWQSFLSYLGIRKKLKKFFLITQGRTGSTAIIDELNTCHALRVAQELFTIYHFAHPSEFEFIYDFIWPFNAWKRQKLGQPFSDSDALFANDYLAQAEELAREQGAAGFGFKVLSNHFLLERPFLSALLKRRGYQAVYLTRNLFREVISLMVAEERGVYNTREKSEDLRRYSIDLDKFEERIQRKVEDVEIDIARLKAEGFDFIIVTYEEFCTDRQSFYNKIFHFLDLPTELPSRSDWAVMIKDLRYTIANYDEVVERAAAIGVPLDS